MSEILTPVSILCDTEAAMVAMEPNNAYHCQDCGFALEGLINYRFPAESYRFRAEQHAAAEGHAVGFYYDWPDPETLVETIR